MKKRSLREDAAQMVMPRIDGPKLNDAAYRERIEELVRQGIGGFILFGGDVEQTPHHLQALQSTAGDPPPIASDVGRGPRPQLLGRRTSPWPRSRPAGASARVLRDCG